MTVQFTSFNARTIMHDTTTTTLAPVRDAISLSDRFSAVYFEVSRSGDAIQYSDFGNGTGKADILFTLQPGSLPWSWHKGWMPVLQIGERYELFAFGDDLFFRDGDTCRKYPSGQAIPLQEHLSCRDSLEDTWRNWFSQGLELPHTSDFLDEAWRSSLVQALCSFAGYRPSYGAGFYRRFCHDSFPPATTAMVETLLQFGHVEDALKTYQCFFDRFVTPDGAIRYYGPALSEYGAMLWLTAKLMDAAPQDAPRLARTVAPMVVHILELFDRTANSCSHPQLLDGSPEADERQKVGQYFHNNFHILLGLRQLAPRFSHLQLRELSQEMTRYADFLDATIALHYEACKTRLGAVPFSTSQTKLYDDIQTQRDAIYANYRYYPEMLECGLLPMQDALSLMDYREKHNGEYQGMTLFTRCDGIVEADNWPMASYGRALLEYGQHERFMRLLQSHARLYISDDTYTAYEQVAITGSPRTANAPACVPVQLLLPRLLAWSFSYTKWNGETVTGLWNNQRTQP